jgi:large subunit ribosomal protein L20
MRKLWKIQINAAARQHGLSYSRFINGLRTHKIAIDKKTLADISRRQPDSFKAIVEQVRPPKQ